MNTVEPVYALVCVPHPDDAEIGVGGTIARWTKEGKDVVYVVCTNGDKGSDDPNMTPVELARIREEEQLAAAEILGVKEVVFLRYHDQELEDTPYRQAAWQGTYYLMFNTTRPPFSDQRVRRALALAIDREKLIATVLGGTELPTLSLVPDHTPGYQPPDVLRYDPGEARILLAEAGYADGAGWPETEYIFNTNENHRKIAVAVQQMWKETLNIEVSLANQEWKVYLDSVDAKEYDIARKGWIAADLNPDSFLTTMTSDNGINRTGFSDARYDEIMLRKAPAIADIEKRYALMQEAETILMNAVPVVPLYTYNSKHLVQPSVKGAPTNVLDILNFKDILTLQRNGASIQPTRFVIYLNLELIVQVCLHRILGNGELQRIPGIHIYLANRNTFDFGPCTCHALVDIQISGISQLANTRAQFVSVIKNKGVDDLISRLQNKIEFLSQDTAH